MSGYILVKKINELTAVFSNLFWLPFAVLRAVIIDGDEMYCFEGWLVDGQGSSEINEVTIRGLVKLSLSLAQRLTKLGISKRTEKINK